MTAVYLSRRQALLMVGAGLVASRAVAASARPKLADPSAPYQAPGGRIGFTRPQGVAPSTNGWILQSDDHTFQVRVQETLAVAGVANPLWDKDKTSTLTGSLQVAGFPARRYKDRRGEPSLDYGQDTIVIAHADWIGEVSVTTSNLSDQAETMEAASGCGTGATRWRCRADGGGTGCTLERGERSRAGSHYRAGCAPGQCCNYRVRGSARYSRAISPVRWRPAHFKRSGSADAH